MRTSPSCGAPGATSSSRASAASARYTTFRCGPVNGHSAKDRLTFFARGRLRPRARHPCKGLALSVTTPPRTSFDPLGGLAAIALPGLGHVITGEWRRGGLIFLGVMGLFLGGMLIGGIDVIDRKNDFWWFVLQAGIGPIAFIVDSIHQSMVSGGVDPLRQSLGRVNEVGSLYAGMAGLVNLIAIIDAAWPAEDEPERRAPAGAEAS